MLRMLPLIMLSETILMKIISTFDSSVYEFISGYISEGMTDFMKFITLWGSWLELSIVSLATPAVVRKSKRYFRYSLLIPLNLMASSLLNYILKVIVQRPRPELLRLIEISGFSFPSGHSMTAMSFYGFLIFFSIRYLKHWTKYCIAGALSILVLAIGISRIYLGVHYASDVFAGFIFGFAWLVVFIKLSDRFVFSEEKHT